MASRLSHLLLVALCILASSATAAEVQLALAPRISLPTDLPIYSEDTVNFYGTNIYLLESGVLRQRVETALGHPAPAGIRVHAERVPNTAILTVSATGVEDSVAMPFLQTLVDQFLQFKREQKKKRYGDAIARVDATLKSAPQETAAQIAKYKAQLVVASLLDTEPDFQRLDQK